MARFVSDANPIVQRKLIENFHTHIASDSVLHMLYEMNPELVERELLIPKLNKMFKALGVRKKVGITHFTRHLKSEVDTIEISENGTGFILKSSNEKFYEIGRFAFERGTSSSQGRRSVDDVAMWRKFLKKYSGKGGVQKIYELSDQTYRSPVIRDISSCGGSFSLSFLEQLHAIKKELEVKHERAGRSLDELLAE